MARVKVWNDNSHDHVETFKGNQVTVPAKGFIEMDFEDAVQFKGQFTPMLIRADGTHDPKGFKMIRVEQPKEPLFKDAPLVNHATGQQFATKAELLAALQEVSHLRAAVDPDAERELPKGDPSEIAALKAQVEALTKLVQGQTAQKKKPGPKPGFRKEAAG